MSREFLLNNPNIIFVFGDNLIHKGHGGGAKFRDLPNTYGFITKKYPNNKPSSFFKLDEYKPMLQQEIEKLENYIRNNPNKIFYISALGRGLANKHGIWKLIKPKLEQLERKYPNQVILLF